MLLDVGLLSGLPSVRRWVGLGWAGWGVHGTKQKEKADATLSPGPTAD